MMCANVLHACCLGRPLAPLGHRRESRVTGMYTRAQVEADLGVTKNELEMLERQKVLAPSEPRRRGDTRPVLFSPTDVAVGRFAQAARHFGLRGEELAVIAQRLATKRRWLQPGWCGFVVVDGHGDVALVTEDQELSTMILTEPQTAVLVVPLNVPHGPSGPQEHRTIASRTAP